MHWRKVFLSAGSNCYMSRHVWKIPRHRGTRLTFFRKHGLVPGRQSLSCLLHWCWLCTKQISSCTIVLLAENVGLFERQEGRGLFPESGWSHAIMQVTGTAHSFATYAYSHSFHAGQMWAQNATGPHAVSGVSGCCDCFLCCSVLDLNAFERQNKAEGLGMVTEEGSGKLHCHHHSSTFYVWMITKGE